MNYEDLTYKDLQAIAEENNLPTYGKKADIIERLKQSSGVASETEPTAEALTPPSDLYKPAAWLEGKVLKVAFQFSGRRSDVRDAYFLEQVRLQAAWRGLEVVDNPFWLFSQGGLTLYGVEVA